MLNIKANSCDDLITSLSGGNQQKVFLARWLNTDAEILLLDNPTQGIDVGAKAEIYEADPGTCKAGKDDSDQYFRNTGDPEGCRLLCSIL